MEKAILVAHLLIAFAIIGMILLQQGKGADAGASFGAGASQTLFGSGGTWNFFSKATAVLATLFFVTSFSLAIIAKNSVGVDEELLPSLQIISAESEKNSGALNGNSDIPVLQAIMEEDISDIPAVGLPEIKTEASPD